MSSRRRGLVVAAAVVVSVTVPVATVVAAEGTVERTLQDPRITESSGLASSILHPGVVWTVNDSGDEARLYAVDTSGATVAVVTLDDVEARDWEGLAAVRGPDGAATLWVGDIGDNQSSWDSVRVHRIPEPEQLTDQTVDAETYDLVFADGPKDAEALLADPASGRLFVASKRASNAGLYALPDALSPDAVNTMTRVAEVPPVVTDGAWSPVDGRFALVGYVYAWVYAGIGAEPERFVLPRRPQGETVTWTVDGTALLVGSEGAGSTIWQVDLGGAKPDPQESPASGEPSVSTLAPADALPGDEGSSPGVGWWMWALGGALLVVGAVVVARR